MIATWRYVKLLYRRGFALFGLAPLIVAIAVLPEFVQHIVEIRIGMFNGGEGVRDLADGALRWSFGYAKLAGLLIAMFAAARFWAAREGGGSWWRLGNVAWLPLAIGLAIFLFAPVLPDLVKAWIPDWAYTTAYWGISLAVAPLLFAILAALSGDRRIGPLAGYWRDWRWVPLLLMLLIAAYLLPLTAHYGLHRLAIGAPPLLLWPLMTVDALVVGLLASLVGAALHLSYAAARPSEA